MDEEIYKTITKPYHEFDEFEIYDESTLYFKYIGKTRGHKFHHIGYIYTHYPYKHIIDKCISNDEMPYEFLFNDNYGDTLSDLPNCYVFWLPPWGERNVEKQLLMNEVKHITARID